MATEPPGETRTGVVTGPIDVMCLRSSRVAVEKQRDALLDALRHIKWIKDGGCDWPDHEGGPVVNQPATERDAMYQIACEALASATDSSTESPK